MSRAFVKEMDGTEAEELPELAVSPHRNLVTPQGLARIEETVRSLETQLADAQGTGDKAAVARAERDLRYWRQRKASAEVVRPVPGPNQVRFGCRVQLETPNGERVSFRVVGEDESDPTHGMISYVSPLAEQLLGASVGDSVPFRQEMAVIVAIE